MKVIVLHNITLDDRGRTAIFSRFGDEKPYQPGDVLVNVYNLIVSERPDMAALEQTYQLLNINHPTDYRFRSLSKGDVVVLSRNGACVAYWCDSMGWEPVDADHLDFIGNEAPAHLERTHLLDRNVAPTSREWVVQHCFDDLWWNNLTGWGSPLTASRFSAADVEQLRLPQDGRWYSATALAADLARTAGRFTDARDDS